MGTNINGLAKRLRIGTRFVSMLRCLLCGFEIINVFYKMIYSSVLDQLIDEIYKELSLIGDVEPQNQVTPYTKGKITT